MSDRTGQYNNYQPYLNAGFNKPGFANLDTFYLFRNINNIRENADLIVVAMHSGSEYSLVPRPGELATLEDEFFSPTLLIPCTSDIRVRRLAIDAGADLVVCHHPHIIQGFEVYNRKLIAHSLGNFCFDLDYPETYPSVILSAKINETGFYEYSVIPVYIDDYIPVRAKGELGIHILDYLVRRSKELGTYLVVDRDSVTAKIVLDTLALTPVVNSYDEQLQLDEANGYWLSKPTRLHRNGSISSILNITPERNWQFRLGRDLTWFWCGNFEDEGSTLWSINQTDEFYDTIAFSGQRSLCQRRQVGSNPIITNLEERIICYSDSTPYTLYGYIKNENSDSAFLAVRFYRSRTSNYNGTIALDSVISGTQDWTFYYKEFIPTSGTQYLDVVLQSTAPESGIGYTWFDDVGVIEWEDWQELDSTIQIPAPNDFYWVQIRTDQPTDSALLSLKETDYNPQVAITNNKCLIPSNPLKADLALKILPNPTNSNTTIQYNLPNNSRVILRIYNALGKEVKTLINEIQHKGQKTIGWDGKDDQGRRLGIGTYFCCLKDSNNIQTKKIILLR